MTVRIDVVFDLPPDHPYHGPTVAAITRAGAATGLETEVKVVPTGEITDGYFDDPPHGVVIGPGTPYNKPSSAEMVIFTAREKGVPLVGT